MISYMNTSVQKEPMINLRAEAAPAFLRCMARQSLAAAASAFAALEAELDHREYFRPSKPAPTHRFTGVAA
jgi:hypothetical protein